MFGKKKIMYMIKIGHFYQFIPPLLSVIKGTRFEINSIWD